MTECHIDVLLCVHLIISTFDHGFTAFAFDTYLLVNPQSCFITCSPEDG